MKYLTPFILVALILYGCDDGIVEGDPGPAPEADFIFQIQTVNKRAVSFASTSRNATVINWDFGDGSGSLEEAPSKTYDANGIYIVSLTASNKSGISTKTETVEIVGVSPPVADFVVGFEDVSSSLQVNLTNVSTDAEIFVWDFGDGNSSMDGSLTSYTYTEGGEYSIRLRAITENPEVIEQNRQSSKRTSVTVVDDRFLTDSNTRTWGFKTDSTIFQGDKVSSYFVTVLNGSSDSLLYQVGLQDCMLDDNYTFIQTESSYQVMNQGLGYRLALGGQCGSVPEQIDRVFTIVRDSNTELALFLSGGYIGDFELGSKYQIESLSNTEMYLTVERDSPVTGDLEIVHLTFAPK